MVTYSCEGCCHSYKCGIVSIVLGMIPCQHPIPAGFIILLYELPGCVMAISGLEMGNLGVRDFWGCWGLLLLLLLLLRSLVWVESSVSQWNQ